jgi:hypothetical protein
MFKAFLAALAVVLLAASGTVVWGKLEWDSQRRAAVGRSSTDSAQATEAPESIADIPPSTDLEWLIKRGEYEDIKCRGGLPDSAFHCAARGKITAKLEKLGLCRGNPLDFDDERRWHNCDEDLD